MTAHRLLDAQGRALPANAGRRARMLAMGEARAYRGAQTAAPDLSEWRPFRMSADAVAGWDLDTLAARADDLYRNAGHIRAAARAKVTKIVGAGWSIIADPDHEALGLSPEEGAALGRKLSAAWREWSADPRLYCDVTRRSDFNGMLRLMVLCRMRVGESLAVLRWRRRPGWRWRTSVQIIDTARLSNPLGEPDRPDLRGGVHLDEDGAPLGVYIQRGHPADYVLDPDALTWDYVPWESPEGRPIVLHHLDHEAPDQNRGLPAVATLMRQAKMLQRYGEAELARATVQALFVAFIRSGFDPASVAESFQDTADAAGFGERWHGFRADLYQKSDIRLTPESPAMPVLAPGDTIDLNVAAGQQSGFNQFQQAFLQEFATTLEVPYPELAQDWSGVNYSSMRAALNEDWKRVQVDRSDLAMDVVNRVYMAVIEEAVLSGHVETPPASPDFWSAVHAWTRLRIVGPGRGHVDPVKERQASLIGIEGGLSTRERELNEQGLTVEDVMRAHARERELAAAYGFRGGDLRALLGLEPATET